MSPEELVREILGDDLEPDPVTAAFWSDLLLKGYADLTPGDASRILDSL